MGKKTNKQNFTPKEEKLDKDTNRDTDRRIAEKKWFKIKWKLCCCQKQLHKGKKLVETGKKIECKRTEKIGKQKRKEKRLKEIKKLRKTKLKTKTRQREGAK